MQHSHLIEVVKPHGSLSLSLSALFLSFITQPMHTTHATQLFLDVTRHVSRTRVHACKHISRCASTRRLCLYFYCIAERKETKPRSTANQRRETFARLPLHCDMHMRIILSHSSFTLPNERNVNSKYRQNSLLIRGQYTSGNRFLRVKTSVFKRSFSQFFCYLKGSARLPGHRVHTCRWEWISYLRHLIRSSSRK